MATAGMKRKMFSAAYVLMPSPFAAGPLMKKLTKSAVPAMNPIKISKAALITAPDTRTSARCGRPKAGVTASEPIHQQRAQASGHRERDVSSNDQACCRSGRLAPAILTIGFSTAVTLGLAAVFRAAQPVGRFRGCRRAGCVGLGLSGGGDFDRRFGWGFARCEGKRLGKYQQQHVGGHGWSRSTERRFQTGTRPVSQAIH